MARCAVVNKPVDVDMARALERMGDDRGLLGQIIDVILEDSRPLLDAVETALGARAFPEVERAAHSLRGLVSNVGCDVVRERATRIEQFARGEDAEAIADALPALHSSVDEMHAILTVARRALPPG
jgi:HPt (histidine-containing phosphotransfer) domain-containing protein